MDLRDGPSGRLVTRPSPDPFPPAVHDSPRRSMWPSVEVHVAGRTQGSEGDRGRREPRRQRLGHLDPAAGSIRTPDGTGLARSRRGRGVPRRSPVVTIDVDGSELLQGGTAREAPPVCDLRGGGSGRSRGAAPPRRGQRVVVRRPPLRGVPVPAGRAGPRRQPHGGVAGRGVLHRPALPCPRPPPRAAPEPRPAPRPPRLVRVARPPP